MMRLNFNQKTNIIDYLAAPKNWSNIFNMNFFTDEARRWPTKQVDGLSVQTSPNGQKCKVTDDKTGRSLLIERQGDTTTAITDERGQTFTVSGGKVNAPTGLVSDVRPIQSMDEFGFTDDTVNTAAISDFNIVLRFDQDGAKSIFAEDLGHRIDMTPDTQAFERANHPGRFFHKVSFTEDTFHEWDVHPAYAMMFAKLVIAKDLNIEPNISAQNELDDEKAMALLLNYLKDKYDEDWDGPEAWRPKIEEKPLDILAEGQKEWGDTTEFGGHDVDIPTRFFIAKTDDGYSMTTSSDAKHSILTQGELLNQARGQNILTIQTVNERTASHSLLHMMNKGQTATDHLDRDWRFVVLESAAASKIITNMNAIAQDSYRIDSHDYAAINFDENLSLLAIEAQTLETLTQAQQASLAVMKMIQDNDTDAGAFRELLEQGADYRFIDPENARNGQTFSDILKAGEYFELLAVLHDAQGVHPDLPDDYDPNENGFVI